MIRLLTLLLIFRPIAAENPSDPRIRLMVPAYFYPAGKGLAYWNQLIDAASKVPIVVTLNPASGPGKAVDDNYQEIIDRALRAKIKLIGYIPTGYGKRPVAEVEADVGRWLEFYPKINGFFLDEQPSGVDGIPYFRELRSYFRRRKPASMLVGNPGTICIEDYFAKNLLDVICLFENKTGADSYQPPAWAAKYSARTYFLPYQVAPDKWRSCLEKALKTRAGYFFVTNDGADGNPWDSMPTYWDELVEAVRAANKQPQTQH